MARNLSWIDTEQLASLIDVVSPEAPEDSTAKANDDSFHSGLFAAAQAPKKTAAPQPIPVRAAATQPPPPPAPAPAAVQNPAASAAPVVAAKPFQPNPDTDLWERLGGYLDWVIPATNSRGVVVTDANGLIVVERGADEIEAAMSASIDVMLDHVSDVLRSGHSSDRDRYDGYVALQRDGLHLTTLWTPSAQGRFFGVLIGETAPHPASLVLAGQGLRTLFAN